MSAVVVAVCVRGRWVCRDSRDRPQISHVIPLRLFQCFKSERWDSAVFETLTRSAVGELRAELVNAGTVVRRWLRVAVCRPLVAGCRTLATVVLVRVGAAPDP